MLREKAKAEADGVQLLVGALGGDPTHTLGLRMISSGQLPQMAASHAEMLGKANLYLMAPNGSDALASLSKLAPSVDLLQRHGFDLPGWLLPRKPTDGAANTPAPEAAEITPKYSSMTEAAYAGMRAGMEDRASRASGGFAK